MYTRRIFRGGDFTCAVLLERRWTLDVAPDWSGRRNVGVWNESLSNEREGGVQDEHVELIVQNWCMMI